nr:intersex-like (Drosophila) [Danio rerio]
MASQQMSTNNAQMSAQQAAVLQQTQAQQLSQQQDFDPVHRFKMLIPPLKDSLQVHLNVMTIASLNFAHNTAIDNGLKTTEKGNDAAVQRFDKSLEEFYALCDQLELCLVKICCCVSVVQSCRFQFKSALLKQFFFFSFAAAGP